MYLSDVGSRAGGARDSCMNTVLPPSRCGRIGESTDAIDYSVQNGVEAIDGFVWRSMESAMAACSGPHIQF